MKSPIVIFRDVETTIKNPFNKNPRVRRAIYEAHNNLLSVMNHIYPGQLILSFNMSAFYNKIIKKVAEINGVSIVEDKKKRRGPYMTVPFGKALSDVLVPNTVTKGLHIDKYFDRTVKSFTIAECQHYSSVDNQVKTIKSFDRPVILIDDLLHKGHRMRMLTPYLEQNGVEIKEVLVGVMTGQAMDMMEERTSAPRALISCPAWKSGSTKGTAIPSSAATAWTMPITTAATAAIRRSTWSCPMSSRLSSARATATPTTYTP